MTPGRIVEPLDVVEYIRSGFVSCPICLRPVRSVFSDEKKLSIAALSQTFAGPAHAADDAAIALCIK
jgi:hypothetical protein